MITATMRSMMQQEWAIKEIKQLKKEINQLKLQLRKLEEKNA